MEGIRRGHFENDTEGIMTYKTISIDELKAEISAVQLLDEIETLEQLTDAIIELVEKNRDAIIAGAQRPLKIKAMCYSDMWYPELIADDGDFWSIDCPVKTKEDAIEVCESLHNSIKKIEKQAELKVDLDEQAEYAEQQAQALRVLQEALDEHGALSDVWITSKDAWIGIALTLDEAFALAEALLPEPDLE